MPSHKKKLPTGPIRIDLPTPKLSDTSGKEAKQKPENNKRDSVLLEDKITESSSQDSINQESKLQAPASQESTVETSSPPKNQESSQPESSLTEYKKVAMRLSIEAAENLRRLRASTGIPYEILVDVMVRNWDNLPQRTQAAYLKQAKQVRMLRLMAGQEKTMRTMQQKFLSL